MIRVKDQAGNIVPGVFKDALGTIVINNNHEYKQYLKDRQSTESINSLNNEIQKQKDLINNITTDLSEMKQLLLSLIEKNSTKGN